MNLRCLFLVKIEAIYGLLVYKTFGLKIGSCKFFDKSQVCVFLSSEVPCNVQSFWMLLRGQNWFKLPIIQRKFWCWHLITTVWTSLCEWSIFHPLSGNNSSTLAQFYYWYHNKSTILVWLYCGFHNALWRDHWKFHFGWVALVPQSFRAL